MPLTDRHEMIRHTARSFAEKEIRPVAAKLDEEEAFPDALYRKMAEIGLFGVSLPDGGWRRRRRHAGLCHRDGGDRAGLFVSSRRAGQCRDGGHAAVALRHRRGRRSATWHRCSPAAMSAASPSPRPKRDPMWRVSGPPRGARASGWILSGEKMWIHNAPNCDFAVVLARTDKDAGHRGMSTFLVERTMARRRSAAGASTRWASAPRQVGPLGLPAASACRRRPCWAPENRGFHNDDERAGEGPGRALQSLAVGILQAGAGRLASARPRPRRQFGQRDRASSRPCSSCSPDIGQGSVTPRAQLTYVRRGDARSRRPRRRMACSIAKCCRQRCRRRAHGAMPSRSSAAAAISAASRSSGSIATPR